MRARIEKSKSRLHPSRLLIVALGCLLFMSATMIRTPGAPQDVKPSDAAQQVRVAATPSESSQDPFIKLKTELVVLSLSVTDGLGRFIPGLKQNQFEILEDDVPQAVKFFSTDDTPISIGIILDVSGSMKSKIARAREAVRRFIEWSNAQDEFFAITFNDDVMLLADFTDGEVLLTYLPFLRAKGRTALFDAVYEGVLKLKHSRYGKRALLVVSDGQDNSSRYSYGALSRLMKEADVQIYTIGTPDPTLYNTYFEQQGISILQQVSKLTGGRHFTVMGASMLEPVCANIARELRQQYNLGYMSSNSGRDAKWRRIQVRVKKEGGDKLKVHAKRGYYAPSGQP